MSPPVALRGYQLEAVEAVISALAGGARAALLEKATGTGKTTSGSEILRRHFEAGGRRVLVLAHRRELVDQFAARAKSFGLTVGIERGKQWSNGEQVVVASVQTLRGPRLAAFPIDEFDLILVDECHHAIADGYQDILKHFPAAKVVGLTATPDRADGRSLGEVFDVAPYRYGIADAVRDEYLVPARGVRVEVPGMDLSKVRQQRFVNGKKLSTPAEGWGDDTGERVDGESRNLHERDLGMAVLAPEAVEGVTGPLVELAGMRRAVVFAVNRAHAKALVESLRARGATAEYVDGIMKAGDREEAKRRHRAGEAQYLVNVGVLTEGYDDQGIECVAIARPTQSRIFFAQACGRGLRLLGNTLAESIAAGKSECLVIDFVGVGCQFSLVGPEDVLAGALVGPVKTIGAAKEETVPEPKDAPAAPSLETAEIALAPRVRWGGGFRTVAIDLMRVAFDVGFRAGKATGRAVKQGAKAARGWLARLLFG